MSRALTYCSRGKIEFPNKIVVMAPKRGFGCRIEVLVLAVSAHSVCVQMGQNMECFYRAKQGDYSSFSLAGEWRGESWTKKMGTVRFLEKVTKVNNGT